MINCPECGADNLIGAIFCRSCGARLNLDDLKPDEIIDEKPDGMAKRVFRIAGRLVVLVIFLLLLLVVGALFAPAPGNVTGAEVTGADLKKVQGRYLVLMGARRARASAYTFTSAEVTALANTLLDLQIPTSDTEDAAGEEGGDAKESGDDDEGTAAEEAAAAADEAGGLLAPAHLSVDLLGKGLAKVVLRSTMFGKVSTYTTLVVEAVSEDDGTVAWTVQEARMGAVPMAGAQLRDLAVSRIVDLLAGEESLEKVKKRIVKLEILEDKVKIHVKR